MNREKYKVVKMEEGQIAKIVNVVRYSNISSFSFSFYNIIIIIIIIMIVIIIIPRRGQSIQVLGCLKDGEARGEDVAGVCS